MNHKVNIKKNYKFFIAVSEWLETFQHFRDSYLHKPFSNNEKLLIV